MMSKQQNKIAVVGFGFVGCTIGAFLAANGYEVVGIDPNLQISQKINLGISPFNETGLQALLTSGFEKKSISVTDDFSAVGSANVVLVSVGTPLSQSGDAELSQILEATRSIKPFLREGQLVLFKSTLPPGTTRLLNDDILENLSGGIKVAFSPERIAEGSAIQELTTIPIVVGGIDSPSCQAASSFWREALGVETIEVASTEEAELVKLADNLWIDLNIALANELAQFSDASKFEADILNVIKAANTLPKGEHYVNILTPSIGVGGYCLTKDPWFVAKAAQKMGIELLTPAASRNVNSRMPNYAVKRIVNFFTAEQLNYADEKICILGISFKNNTGDCRFSPAIEALQELRGIGFKEIIIVDPWVNEIDASELNLLLEKDIARAIQGASAVCFFAGHNEFRELRASDLATAMKRPGLVFDGRMFFPRSFILELQDAGLAFLGVGR